MVKVFIGAGSNLGNKKRNILEALKLLNSIREIDIKQCSKMLETEPRGYKNQPKFLNCAWEIETNLKPEKLLSVLKKIEKKLGRKKTFKWGPRIIDLDILFYGNRTIRKKNLAIPHPEMLQRDFVLKPLKEIASEFVHPVIKMRIKDI